MAEVVVYSSGHCPYCVQAKRLLTNLGQTFAEIRVDEQPEEREAMISRTGRRTVPQIIIDGQPVGGFDDISALHRQGKLLELLGLKDENA